MNPEKKCLLSIQPVFPGKPTFLKSFCQSELIKIEFCRKMPKYNNFPDIKAGLEKYAEQCVLTGMEQTQAALHRIRAAGTSCASSLRSGSASKQEGQR